MGRWADGSLCLVPAALLSSWPPAPLPPSLQVHYIRAVGLAKKPNQIIKNRVTCSCRCVQNQMQEGGLHRLACG